MKITIKYINQGIKIGDTIHCTDGGILRSTIALKHLSTFPGLIKHIEREIVGPCDLPITQDIVAQLKPGDRILLKPPTCPEYDDIPRSDYLNAEMGLEHKIETINLDLSFLHIKTNNIPILIKEIAKITFICKR